MIFNVDDFQTQWEHIDRKDLPRYGILYAPSESEHKNTSFYVTHYRIGYHEVLPMTFVMAVDNNSQTATLYELKLEQVNDISRKYETICTGNLKQCLDILNNILTTRLVVDIDLIW